VPSIFIHQRTAAAHADNVRDDPALIPARHGATTLEACIRRVDQAAAFNDDRVSRVK
jgi:hypothetical protein